MIPGYRDFEFDLPEALLVSLIAVLDGMQAFRLDADALRDIPDAQGIYLLFVEDKLVYIGKADTKAGLRSRLGRHGRKVQHRVGLDPRSVAFKAVRIYVFTALDLEKQLIQHYGGKTGSPWNGSGFGSNDPGGKRDETDYKPEHFDSMFPINIDFPLDLDISYSGTSAHILGEVKSALPYVFRFESTAPKSRKPHPNLTDTQVVLSADISITARNVITAVVSQLPPGWQAIQLPSHIILYKSNRMYPHGTVIASS